MSIDSTSKIDRNLAVTSMNDTVNPANTAENKGRRYRATAESRFNNSQSGSTIDASLGNLYVSVQGSEIPRIEQRDANAERTGETTYYQYGGSIGYGVHITSNIIAGARLNGEKRAVGMLESYSGTVDAGIAASKGSIALGLVAENLGMQSDPGGAKYLSKTPFTVRAGGKLGIGGNLSLLLGGSYANPTKEAIGAAGAEYTLFKTVTFRAGFETGHDSLLDSINFGLGANAGKVPILGGTVQVDYTFRNSQYLGPSHKICLTVFQPFTPKPVVKEKPVEAPAPKPAPMDFDFEVTGGGGSFKRGRSDLASLTEQGRKDFIKSQKLIHFLYANGLVNISAEVHIEGNASAEGTAKENEKLSKDRAMRGMELFQKAIYGLITSPLQVVMDTPESEANAKMEEGFAGNKLEAFREGYRSFRIKLKLNKDALITLSKDPAFVKKMRELAGSDAVERLKAKYHI